MKRRQLLFGALALGMTPFLTNRVSSGEMKSQSKFMRVNKTDREWKESLTKMQYYVLREEGTERAFSSPLYDEKRKGTYVCVGCDHPLFTSDMKYDSGTGWPSFFTTLDNAFETKLDFALIYPRTEYHCAKCGGHHGHRFNDGPEPTGQRWCNNGVALKFIPA